MFEAEKNIYYWIDSTESILELAKQYIRQHNVV